MRRFVGWSFASLVLLLLVVAGIYVGLIHPNDKRLNSWKTPAEKPRIGQFYQHAASLFQDRVPHSIDMDAAEYSAAKKALLEHLPEYASGASVRFVSPYQVYAPIGSYPFRLDARDAVFVPAGKTLTIRPGLTGTHLLRLSLVSITGESVVELRRGTADVYVRWAAPELRAEIGDRTVWQRMVMRSLKVERSAELSHWRDYETSVDLAAGDALSLTCQGKAPGCLIAEPLFLKPTTTQPRNVLIILTDTLRADGPFGGNAPVMAAFAEQATVFTHAMAAGNMTSPSTNAFLSCRKPSDLGAMAFSYSVSGDYRENFYKEGKHSFPWVMREHGVDTAMIGNVSVISEIYGVGVQHGFGQQVSIERDAYDTPDIAQEASDWLAHNGDHPFFLYVHFNGPHAPYRAPWEDVKRTFPGWDHVRSYPSALRWLYQSEISYTDRYLKRVLDALKALGLDQTTTVVLTADHGDQHTNHRFAGNEVGRDFTGAYFDHGATLLDDEIHVPLMMRVPGVAGGRRVSGIVPTLDTGPTLLATMGIETPGYCAGRSLLPLIRGEASEESYRERVLGSEAFQGRAIVYGGRYKYIRTYEPTDKIVYPPEALAGEKELYMVRDQLYDLERDPSEEQNLAPLEPARLGEAKRLYDAYYKIEDAYELDVDSPEGQDLEVRLPADTQLRTDPEEGLTITRGPEDLRVSGHGFQRVVLTMKKPSAVPPVVLVGGKELRITMTASRLPLASAPETLPRERAGRYNLLDLKPLPAAYLRRIEDDGQSARRIVTGNARFEQVLREWGYLNDR